MLIVISETKYSNTYY